MAYLSILMNDYTVLTLMFAGAAIFVFSVVFRKSKEAKFSKAQNQLSHRLSEETTL